LVLYGMPACPITTHCVLNSSPDEPDLRWRSTPGRRACVARCAVHVTASARRFNGIFIYLFTCNVSDLRRDGVESWTHYGLHADHDTTCRRCNRRNRTPHENVHCTDEENMSGGCATCQFHRHEYWPVTGYDHHPGVATSTCHHSSRPAVSCTDRTDIRIGTALATARAEWPPLCEPCHQGDRRHRHHAHHHHRPPRRRRYLHLSHHHDLTAAPSSDLRGMRYRPPLPP
jgi:hypothetical protein